MEAVPAANHLQIHFEASVWRLVSTEMDSPTTLIEATPEGMIAHPVFRVARSLPSSTLSPAQITRVMLGYAPESRAWRLGMLLIDGPASKVDTAQMQWCELAAWPDESFSFSVDTARVAGQTLARLINRPFQFVEPNTHSKVAIFTHQSAPVELGTERAAALMQPPVEDELFSPLPTEQHTAKAVETTVDEPILPDIAPLAPPLRFDGWRLMPMAAGVRWQRVRSWWLINFIRLLGLGTLSVLFLILGIGSKTRGLAEVDLAHLPDIGLFIGALLLITLMLSIWRLLRESATVVDTLQREVYEKGLLLPFINWRVPFDNIQYLLITQSSPRAQGRRRKDEPMNIAQEFWIHIFDGEDFYLVADLGTIEGKTWAWDIIRKQAHTQVRRGLHLAHYDTAAHHAAQHLAQLIGVPVYLDLN